MSNRVILVNITTLAKDINIRHRYRGINFEIASPQLAKYTRFKIKYSLLYNSNFALNFILNVINKRL